MAHLAKWHLAGRLHHRPLQPILLSNNIPLDHYIFCPHIICILLSQPTARHDKSPMAGIGPLRTWSWLGNSPFRHSGTSHPDARTHTCRIGNTQKHGNGSLFIVADYLWSMARLCQEAEFGYPRGRYGPAEGFPDDQYPATRVCACVVEVQ